MPRTARRYNKNIKAHLKNAPELCDARTNIMLGSSYLKQLLDKLGSVPLALASYNGGEDAVRDWLKNGKYRTVDEFIEDIPYNETRNYVKKVLTTYFEYLRCQTAIRGCFTGPCAHWRFIKQNRGATGYSLFFSLFFHLKLCIIFNIREDVWKC